MKSKFLKLVCIVLALMFSLATASAASNAASAAPEVLIPLVFSADADYNEEVSMGVLKEYSDEEIRFSKENISKKMTFVFESKDNHHYTVSGLISLPAGEKSYSAEGVIEQIVLSNGKVGGIGNLLGVVEGNTINISLHTVPEEQKLFAYVTVGEITSISKYLTFTYGDLFDEMNELVESYLASKKDVVTDATASPPASIFDSSTNASKSANDYNTTYRNISIGSGELLNGNSVELAAVTVYTPKRMESNANYKSRVKVNGSANNAYIYVQGAYLTPGVLSVWTSGGTCKLNSNDDYVDFSEMDPGNESWSVEIPVPYYIGGSFGWLPWNINIGFSTIRIERTKNNPSSLCYGNALWKHNYSENVDWGSSGAAATQIGYAGVATTTYYYNYDYDYTTYVYGSGSVSYQYRSQFGATQYTGGFTCNTGSASASIIIDQHA